jgi:hypothetical protein
MTILIDGANAAVISDKTVTVGPSGGVITFGAVADNWTGTSVKIEMRVGSAWQETGIVFSAAGPAQNGTFGPNVILRANATAVVGGGNLTVSA